MRFFFSKLLIFHCLNNPLKKLKIKINLFLLNIIIASNNYSIQQCEEALSIIYKSDLKIKGINSSSYNHFELLKEILGKIMNL